MRLTTRRGWKRVSLVDELARVLKENVKLRRKLLEVETDLALARSSANEWRDRYHSAKDPSAGWVATR